MKRLQAQTLLLVGCLTPRLYSQEVQVECASGWHPGVTRVIPSEWMDDGYCDCPLDGLDEPNTAACSGSQVGGWTGIPKTTTESAYFQCPQQPTLKVPLSRVHDGICDCCDGADEDASVCEDSCQAILEAERLARQQIEESFQLGYAKRQEEIKAFQQLRDETMVELGNLDESIASLQSSLNQQEQIVADGKAKYLQQRMDLASELKSINGILDVLSNDELLNLLYATCQLSGELETTADDNTCVPLRLAALDVGILWDPESLDEGESPTISRATGDAAKLKSLADIVDRNAHSDKKIWSGAGLHGKSHRRDRRRLDDYFPDDDDYYGDEMYGEDDDDMYSNRDYEAMGRYSDDENDLASSSGEQVEGKRQKLLELVKATPLSQQRISFVNQADAVQNSIQEKLDAAKAQEKEEDGEEEEKTPPVDPMEFQMVQKKLRQRTKLIEQGYRYAMSARLLLGSLDPEAENYPSELMNLAAGTIYHNQLSTTSLWQLLQVVLPELSETVVVDEETCASPLSAYCPPRTVERTTSEGVTISLPPEPVLKAGVTLCESQLDATSSCADVEVPSTIPDGYLGYQVVKPREEDDFLNSVFAKWNELQGNREQIDKAEEERDSLKDDLKRKKRDLKELEDEIGGRDEDSNMYGPDGELHSLKDKCFEVEAGKYVYELCLFGKAKQRDRDQKHGGTDLGKFKDMEVDDVTGERTWKWEMGAKCWNGPNRSATAHVKCGAETKILSADEPDTCRYVLEVESHVACDEALKEKLSL